MGISSNQARFLALTSRQVDLESRIQQICQRRLRLSSELENVATSYNNQISNRRLYTMNTSNGGISEFTRTNIQNSGYFLIGREDKSTDPSAISLDTRFMPGQGFKCWSIYNWIPEPTNFTVTLEELGLPTTATESEATIAAVKAGFLSIGKLSDEFTQTPVSVWAGAGTVDCEILDWRTIPAFSDELYKGDDVDAENKYDKTVAEINSQDKKLQLEQTSIEVEYKAVSSERESVKKILDNNAQSSFKYFS